MYILRLEGFRVREDLQGSDVGNLPDWCNDDAPAFFEAADRFERKNGAVGKELIVAVPRGLPSWAQQNLIAELVDNIAGTAHGYCYGFHVVRSSDGGANPHVHLLWSERISDGHPRPRERYFARATPFARVEAPHRDPHSGGCRKSRRFALFARSRTGFAGSPELLKLRRWWAERCNYWLAQARLEANVSERSYKARGIDRVPGVHLYASAARITERGGESRRAMANAAAAAANTFKPEASTSPAPLPVPMPGSKGLCDPAAEAARLKAALKVVVKEGEMGLPVARRRKPA